MPLMFFPAGQDFSGFDLCLIGADGVGDQRVYVIEQTLCDSVSHVAQSNESEFYLI